MKHAIILLSALLILLGFLINGAIADDTATIQAALDSGPVVHLPAGTFVVHPPLVVRAGQTIHGDGCTLRVRDGVGDYFAILMGETATSDLSGLAIRTLTIDQNTRANPLKKSSKRNAILVCVGQRVRVTGCRFVDCGGSQTVEINGPDVRDGEVRGCSFESVGHPVDHSTIYLDGRDCRVADCTFRGKGSGVTTAIETHGSGHRVTGNTVDDYLQGVNVCGPGEVAIVSDNVFRGVAIGVHIWLGLSELSILDNTILLDGSKPTPITGIRLNSSRTRPVSNARISGNTIRLTRGGSGDSRSAAIHWWSVDQGIEDRNIAIEHNTIDGSLGAGIHWAARVRGLGIRANQIVNPGQGTASYAPDYRSGILLATSAITDGVVAGNTIQDTQPKHTIGYGVRIAVSQPLRLVVMGNRLSAQDGAQISNQESKQ